MVAVARLLRKAAPLPIEPLLAPILHHETFPARYLVRPRLPRPVPGLHHQVLHALAPLLHHQLPLRLQQPLVQPILYAPHPLTTSWPARVIRGAILSLLSRLKNVVSTTV
jgi:hypothetical protein